MNLYSFSDKYVSPTCYLPKQLPGYNSRDGGKITDQANVEGNASNTLERMETNSPIWRASKYGVLPNSVCLNEVARSPNVVPRRVQDLLGARFSSSYTTQTSEESTREEKVEIKQRELVQLAKLKGIYDKEVLNRQMLLARSRLFREHAVEMISKKDGSQTPGIDKEIYDKDKDETFEGLVEYLRDMIYHPNQYKASAVKRV